MSISNFKANINFRHFKCCYHDANDRCKLYAIYGNVDMKMIRSIWSPWQKELGATAMKTETMPCQRPGSDNSLSDRRKRGCGCAEHAKDGGVIPGTGFPRDDGMTTRRNME